MKRPILITNLDKYTDFNKARAFDKLVSDMQEILAMYADASGPTDSLVSEITARLLGHAWDLLIQNGEEDDRIGT